LPIAQEFSIEDFRFPICGSEPDEELPIEDCRLTIGGSEQAQERRFPKLGNQQRWFFQSLAKVTRPGSKRTEN
jgi:hypothetical protein